MKFNQIFTILGVEYSTKRPKADQSPYESIDAKVYVKDEDFVTGVSMEDFTRYTQNEEENERVIRANQLIHSLDMVSKYVKVYPVDIQRGTSAFIKYDFNCLFTHNISSLFVIRFFIISKNF